MKQDKYEQVVAAAISETRSKFALAEALATEIPPMSAGRPANDSDAWVIPDLLLAARAAIIDAGGEPRASKTLSNYRLTAIWVRGNSTLKGGIVFRWLPGVSFTAHKEARTTGMSYEEFLALPVKSVDAIRAASGKAGTDGPAVKIAERWSPEEKAEVAKALIIDNPVIAEEVEADLDVQKALNGAYTKSMQGRKAKADATRARNEREARAEEAGPTQIDAMESLHILWGIDEFKTRAQAAARTPQTIKLLEMFAGSLRFDADIFDTIARGDHLPPSDKDFEAELRAVLGDPA